MKNALSLTAEDYAFNSQWIYGPLDFPQFLKQMIVVSIKGGIFSGARQHTLAALGSPALHLKKNPPFNTHLPFALNSWKKLFGWLLHEKILSYCLSPEKKSPYCLTNGPLLHHQRGHWPQAKLHFLVLFHFSFVNHWYLIKINFMTDDFVKVSKKVFSVVTHNIYCSQHFSESIMLLSFMVK